MKHYPRHRATSPRYIFKDTYEEILAYAKRKYSSNYCVKDEFYLFKTEYDGKVDYSAGSVDIYGSAFEHWVKLPGGRWQKV